MNIRWVRRFLYWAAYLTAVAVIPVCALLWLVFRHPVHWDTVLISICMVVAISANKAEVEGQSGKDSSPKP